MLVIVFGVLAGVAILGFAWQTRLVIQRDNLLNVYEEQMDYLVFQLGMAKAILEEMESEQVQGYVLPPNFIGDADDYDVRA